MKVPYDPERDAKILKLKREGLDNETLRQRFGFIAKQSVVDAVARAKRREAEQ